jgi:CheY-like chemotaxis protein
MADAVADFRAEVDSSRSEREGFESARVLASETQLAFVTDDAKRRIALSALFDVSQGVPTEADAGGQQTLTLAFHDGETRETVTIRGPTARLRSFQLVLFSLLFDGIECRVRTEHRDRSDGFSAVSLAVTDAAIQFGDGDETRSVDHTDVVSFETTRSGAADGDSRPAVFVYWADETTDAKTTLVMPTFRHLNLLGRYLQLYTPTSGVATGDGKARILLVDDDAYDLEMTELMLSQQVPELSVETAGSASAGFEVLGDDDPVHCVVSDYDMPGTDGIEFLREVRGRRPDLPFVLFTGQGSEAVAKQALLSDVTDYVEKGIGDKQYEILADRVVAALGGQGEPTES